MLLALVTAWVAADSMRYLDNGVVRIGVDLAKGGAITYLSQEGGPNLVNSFDLGRQIQMSYYSGPVPFAPKGKQPRPDWAGLGWNPIQTGDCYGHPSKTLECRADRREIYLKCVPMQWPLDNEPGECTFESWIRLNRNTVEVKNRIVNLRSDVTQYPARTQELPAVYTNAPWHRLVTYSGDKPYTNGDTTEIPQHPWGPAGPWTSFQATERWAALLDDSGVGIGIWSPDTTSISGGFVGRPGVGGPADAPTGYIAPNLSEILDHDIVYDSRYVLILGDLANIRRYVVDHQPRRLTPDYVFFHSTRQHWTLANATDLGWPLRGEWRIKMEAPDPQLIGPPGFWSATDGPILTLDAAFTVTQTTAQIFWARQDDPGFSESKSLTFPVISDGRMHRYHIDLSVSPEYRGAITQLRLDPEASGHPGDEAVIRMIRVGR